MVRLVHVCLFFFLMLSQIFLSCVAVAENEGEYCPLSFDCGNLGNLGFPFTVPQRDRCGVLAIQGCDDKNPNVTKTLQFSNVTGPNKQQLQLQVKYIKEAYRHPIDVFVTHEGLENDLANGRCEALSYNFTLPPISPLGYLQIADNVTLYKCKRTLKVSPPKQFLNYTGCSYTDQNETIFFGSEDLEDPTSLGACSRVQLPVNRLAFSGNPFTFITAEFPIQVQVSDDCHKCLFPETGRGQCRLDGQRQLCSKSKGMQTNIRKKDKLYIHHTYHFFI